MVGIITSTLPRQVLRHRCIHTVQHPLYSSQALCGPSAQSQISGEPAGLCRRLPGGQRHEAVQPGLHLGLDHRFQKSAMACGKSTATVTCPGPESMLSRSCWAVYWQVPAVLQIIPQTIFAGISRWVSGIGDHQSICAERFKPGFRGAAPRSDRPRRIGRLKRIEYSGHPFAALVRSS